MSQRNDRNVAQMQSGGWTSANLGSSPNSPQKVGQSYTQETANATKKLVQPISVNGQLLGCLQGYLPARSDDNVRMSANSMLLSAQKRIAYAADITLLPEGLRKGATLGVLPEKLPTQKNSSIEWGVEWSKKFSYSLLYALHQVLMSIIFVVLLNRNKDRRLKILRPPCTDTFLKFLQFQIMRSLHFRLFPLMLLL